MLKTIKNLLKSLKRRFLRSQQPDDEDPYNYPMF